MAKEAIELYIKDFNSDNEQELLFKFYLNYRLKIFNNLFCSLGI
jgi:predicted RNase H-like HicB family nuclease